MLLIPDEIASIAEMVDAVNRTWEPTERARAEAALRESEEKYRTLFNSMDEGYCIIQMIYDDTGDAVDWLFLETNPAFEKHNGLHDAAGRTIVEMVPTIERKWVEIYNSVAVTGVSRRFQETSVPLGRTFDLYAFRVGSPLERKVAVLFTDITERKLTEASLLLSEQRHRIALESAEMAAWDWNILEDKVACNDRHYLILGLAIGSGVESSSLFLEFVHPEDRESVRNTLDAAVRAGGRFQADFRIIRRDSREVRWMTGFGGTVELRDGKSVGMTGVMFDSTAAKVMTEELKAAHEQLEAKVRERTEELRAALSTAESEASARRRLEDERESLIERLVNSQEEERLRISHDLHDNLSQHMVSVKMGIDALRRDLLSGDAERRGQTLPSLQELSSRVDSLLSAAHRQAWELRPPELDHLGLEVALEHYASVWALKCDVQVEWKATSWGNHRMDAVREIALYRVVQEALSNVARHSHATKVSLHLQKEDSIRVTIKDNGIGFDQASCGGRLGIVGMRERMSLLGGSLEVYSKVGCGTKVEASVPT